MNQKGQDSVFDKLIGSYFGAELFDQVGLYILDSLEKIYKSSQIILHRDVALEIVKQPRYLEYEK